MKNKMLKVGCVVVLSMVLITMGCETYGGAAGLGAGLGAGAGAIIGHKNPLVGALIGAGVGALTGLIIHDVIAHQKKTAQETAKEYNYTPEQGQKVVLQDAQVNPGQIEQGKTVQSSIQYAVLGSGSSGMKLKETRVLAQNGKVLSEISAKDVTRNDGTWESSQEIEIPKDLPLGTYEIKQAVAVGTTQQFERVGTFEVTPARVAMLTR